MATKILFQEKQKFTQWWLWLLLLWPLAYVLYAQFAAISQPTGNTSGNLSLSIIMPSEYWIILVVTLVIAFLFLVVRMETTIDSEKIMVKHLFLVKKEFRWEEITTAEIINYGFVGYGIRISLKHGTVYNVKGKHGLFITLQDGRKRLIGTQRPEELRSVVKEMRRPTDLG
ncbi:hypothetical protein FGM00_10305 [Aggregatimonas sangjinii]|uniref:Uncharacterized protein n=1 Tax=Aggregatimonas sangjinii TaxID=2583587 RepID=A0A5B7SV28_9FLAO|nr:hypothetical protein [Aggregatimonas sangjinii]QCX00484.1 hypothetical protein FGM00_10305 [Aggregatimonas sangjinii]